MPRFTATLTFVGLLALAPMLAAQTPNGPMNGPPPRGPGGPQRGGPGPGVQMGPAMGPGPDIGAFLLAHTGELKLSDQQVTRLAAIARRTADQRQSMRRSMDSLMTSRRGEGDSSARGRMGPPPAMIAAGQRMRDQAHADLRDALSVLTPDQQATAWESIAMRGAMGGRAGRAAPMRDGGGMPRFRRG